MNRATTSAVASSSSGHQREERANKRGHEMSTKKIEPKQYRRLPVKLDVSSISKRAEKIAAVLQERAHVDQEKRDVAARYSTRIKTLDAEINDLAKAIATGSEEQDVEVIEKPNFAENTMETIRVDLTEVVFSRQLRDDEKQVTIPGSETDAKPETVRRSRKAPGQNSKSPVADAAAGVAATGEE